jgi:hypothetical protein
VVSFNETARCFAEIAPVLQRAKELAQADMQGTEMEASHAV